MPFSSLFTLLCATVASASPMLLARVGVIPPQGFNITSIGVNGSGCPAGSAYYVLSVDQTAVAVTFSNYYADAGPGVGTNRSGQPPNFKRSRISTEGKNVMVIGANIHLGSLFQRTGGIAPLLSAFESLVAFLLPLLLWTIVDTISLIQRQAIFQNSRLAYPSPATARSSLVGPISGADYTYRDTFDSASTILSPCRANTVLNIQSSLQVRNNTAGSGYIATDSLDTKLNQTFQISFQTCK